MLKYYPVPQPSTNAEISDWQLPECDHSFELRFQTARNAAVTYRFQCTKCGESGRVIARSVLTEDLRKAAKPFDSDLRDDAFRRRLTAIDEQRKGRSSDRSVKWMSWYTDYLASSIWKEKSALVLKRAEYVCEACQMERATQAHHLTYAHVGKEPLFDLVAICRNCHNAIHDVRMP